MTKNRYAGSGRTRGGASPLRDERGMLLVITMIVLLVVSSLAGASLVNSLLERNLARNQNYASLALQAAEAGVADGVTWLNLNGGAVPNHTVTPNWTQALAVRDLSRDLNGDGDALDAGETMGSYTVTMRFKREWRSYNDDDTDADVDDDDDCVDPGESSGYKDVDGSPSVDCPGDIVLFNRGATTVDGGFGFTGSLWMTAGQGFPVIEIDSVGTYGAAGRREILLDVARNKLLVKAFGAVTSSSNVGASGNIDIDGRAHDINGVLCPPLGAGSCSCTTATPGVVVDTGHGVTSGGSSALSGDPGPSDNLGTYGATPKSPEEALGLQPGDLESFLGGTPGVGSCLANGSIRYCNVDSEAGNGTGVLIVHNPLFDSTVWDVSVNSGQPGSGYNPAAPVCDYASANPADKTNCYDPKIDASNAAYDAAYKTARKPRNFDQHANITWKGVIIADQIDKINGSCNFIGAVISLSTIATNILGNGAADLFYSCDAIEQYASTQGYATRIGWHRIR